MELRKTPLLNQPANLQLLGRPPLNCIIAEISNKEIALALSDPLTGPPPVKGDLAEIQVNSGQPENLKIRACIEQVTANTLLLLYINPQDPNVRRLVNWFSQHSASPFRPPLNQQQILQELCDISLRQLSGLFEIYLEHCDNGLLRLAEVASNNAEQNKLFEAKSQLRQHGDAIKTLFCNYVQTHFQVAPASTTPNKLPTENDLFENMALVDQKEFEDWLSLEKIIHQGNNLYQKPLACLTQRYSQLVHAELAIEDLPVSIQNVCRALHETLKIYPFSSELLPIIYRFFNESVITRLEDLFDTLNNKLKSYGVLPNIESQILRIHSSSAGKNIPRRRSSDFNASADTENNQRSPLQLDNPKLFSTVKNILTLLHNNTASPDTESVASAIEPSELVATLDALQHDQQAINALAEAPSLQSWLENAADIQLSGELQQQINLISDIFANMDNYPQITKSIISKIKRLEIPMAKMALLDPNFLAAPDHPAKLLLNQLIDLCLNSDMPNQSLEKKFEKIIGDITDNFQQDSSIFQQALSHITSIAEHQNTAYSRNIERITQTYDGRQRVQHALNAVEREIQKRVSPPEAPDIIIELIDNGWKELLKLTYIKLGKDSNVWHEHLETLDQLLLWTSESDNNDMHPQDTIERELEADSFADLIAQQLHDVFPGDYRYQGTIEKIRDTLKGLREIMMVPVEPNESLDLQAPNELQKELAAANPQLTRWIKRAKSLQAGEEFSYLGDETGHRNIRLAWVSDNRQHFVFVNNRGQKVLDFDLIDLANELSKGLSPVAEKNEWPLIENSLYSTVQDAYQQLAFKSNHDELTGLISRKECERLLGQALVDAKNNWQHHCLLYMDIDQFSLTNNLHGHEAGDQLLIDISKFLAEKAPENSMIGRMAGNEFVMLLQRKNMQESHTFAKSLCNSIENHKFHWQQHTIELTTSIGLMVINKYTENVVDLVRNAVAACQIAKDSGGNRVYEFRQDADLHSRREKLLSWIDKLNNVLSSDKLVLRGQKISPLNPDEDHPHYEILLAIKDENGKLVSPVEFIEAAECYNRMQRVDRWVIEHTFQWLNKLSSHGIEPPAVSINLSGNSLNDEHFMDFILEQFALYKVPTNKVCFEVTETATINNLAEAADFIREIKKLGCKFSLDDFGSGNASYQYLKHLPVDYLKIDGMFVKGMDKNKNDQALVKSINDIAHLMGKKTIAEYAESEEIIKLLAEMNVDYIQGYAVSKPIELDKLYNLD